MTNAQEAVLMTEIASSDRLWTRAAIRGGRIFVCFPRWFADEHMRMSVGELVSPGSVKPYPNREWNSWERGDPPGDKFVCVQSVYFDDEGRLWVLDSARPTNLESGMHGVLESGGPKLYQFDVETGKCITTYSFSKRSYRDDSSYFNDVRVYTERQKAFITDSGAGALIVLDLRTGDSRRLLERDDSVRAQEGFVLKINGKKWLHKDGKPRQVHSDGIALSPDRKYLYYQALTGETLYRIRTELLLQEPSPADLAPEVIGKTGPADGIQFGADGRLYLTAIAGNAITRLVDPHDSESKATADFQIVIEGVAWGDSIMRAADGSLYVTTSRIHLQSSSPKDPPRGPFQLFRLQVGTFKSL